jgi:hypothetical protein
MFSVVSSCKGELFVLYPTDRMLYPFTKVLNDLNYCAHWNE